MTARSDAVSRTAEPERRQGDAAAVYAGGGGYEKIRG